jgi:hypothetical protein
MTGVGRVRNKYWGLLEKPKGRRPLGRPKQREEGNVGVYLKEARYIGAYWIQLAQDKDVWGAVVNTE